MSLQDVRMFFYFCLLILEFPNGIPHAYLIVCVFHMSEQPNVRVHKVQTYIENIFLIFFAGA